MQLFYLLTLLILSIILTVDSTEEFINNAKGMRRFLIFPGTKWCGPGNRAEDDSDLGENKQLDTCCRNHDQCQPKIRAGEVKYGIANTGHTSLLSCTCDMDFYNCLRTVNSWTSRMIGTGYFNLLRRQCFNFDSTNNATLSNLPKYTSQILSRISSFFHQ